MRTRTIPGRRRAEIAVILTSATKTTITTLSNLFHINYCRMIMFYSEHIIWVSIQPRTYTSTQNNKWMVAVEIITPTLYWLGVVSCLVREEERENQ